MKKLVVCLVPALALLFISTVVGRADEFSRIQNSPYTYWVPAPPGYMAGSPPPYYYGPPPPGYYGPYGPPPPPAPPVVVVPGFFFGVHFH